MVKAGDLYMELVAKVREALDPGATVKTGQWIEGPDGEREVDVEVRGTVDGNLHFVLVEAKDWKKRVDVQTVDALDSNTTTNLHSSWLSRAIRRFRWET